MIYLVLYCSRRAWLRGLLVGGYISLAVFVNYMICDVYPSMNGPFAFTVKKVPLKPFHWMKVPKAAPGGLWARVEFLDESSQ